MMRPANHLWRSERGAVAPIVALSLFGLIGVGGLAFDYARLASLDTEMQDAADQAALAAASQLDRQTGAVARATAAATGLLSNSTLFANDGNASKRDVTIPSVHFYATKAEAEAVNGAECPTANEVDVTSAAADASARFVCVGTSSRIANYALTPLVGAFRSGNVSAMAVAGLGSSICKVPPVMLCNPDELSNNINESLKFNASAGVGLRLVTGNASAPGNFGWLQAGLENGTQALAGALGYNNPPGDCQPITGVETKTGMDAAVLNAFNTRFDVFANGNTTCPSQNGGGTCSPSRNTRKDLLCDPNNDDSGCKTGNWSIATNFYKLPTVTTSTPVTTTEKQCTGHGKDKVCVDVEVTTIVTTTATTEQALPSDKSQDPSIMGYPRDLCHSWPRSSQTCAIKGSGTWDRDAYFRVNYDWTAAQWPTRTGLGSAASRWAVYQWELAHRAVHADGSVCATIDSTCKGIDAIQKISNSEAAFGRPATGVAGVSSSSSQADRRRISVAVINCQALNLNGKSSGIPVPTWLDVFLVEPAIDRTANQKQYTDQKDIYVEQIGETQASGNNGAGQVVRRDLPYLVK